MKTRLKLSYNSPVILTYCAICLVCLIVNSITGNWFNRMFLVCYGHPSLLDPLTYLRLFSYAFGHSGVSHFTGNMIMMLLVGPIAEEKYGSFNLAVMIAVTALAGGILNSVFFSTGLIGASGIVFMLIILCAFTGMKRGEIPLTLILVAVAYLGQEVYDGLFTTDNVSHFGHLVGGVSGLVFGILYHKKKFALNTGGGYTSLK